MTSYPNQSYTLKTSSARPTPCVPSTAIVQTLCVATAISRPRARARFLLLLCRRRRLSALPRRLRLRANIFLFSMSFSIFPLSLSPFLPCTLYSPRGFSRPTPRRLVHLPSPGRISCLLTDSSPSSRFPRRYASFGVMAVGTNGLTCGFNCQCTADTIGYVVMITARLDSLPSPHSLPRFGAHLGREAAGVCAIKLNLHIAIRAKASLVLNLLVPHWVEMRTNARAARTQNYDQAPAMNWNHAVSWGRGWGVWVSVSDSIIRVGLANRSKPHIYKGLKPETPPPNPLKMLSHDQ